MKNNVFRQKLEKKFIFHFFQLSNNFIAPSVQDVMGLIYGTMMPYILEIRKIENEVTLKGKCDCCSMRYLCNY